MNNLYIMCGPSFAGKTSLAHVIARRENCAYLSLDEISEKRGLQGGDGIPNDEWEETHQIALARMDELMAKGGDVIVDDTSPLRWPRDRFTEVATRHGYKSWEIYAATSRDDIRHRMQFNEATGLRASVQEQTFNELVEMFEEPGADENVLLYNPDDSPGEWTKRIFPTLTADLVALHLRLWCVNIDPKGDLVPMPCPYPWTVPRFYIAQSSDDGTFSRFVRPDISEEIREALLALPPEHALQHHDRVKRILAAQHPCDDVYHAKRYFFPVTFALDVNPTVVRITERHRALVREYDGDLDMIGSAAFAVIMNGKIVSTCDSIRENDTAAEARVRTLPEYRKRNLAKHVTAMWAAHVLNHKKIPFYSHRMDNVASERLASSLAVVPFVVGAMYQ